MMMLMMLFSYFLHSLHTATYTHIHTGDELTEPDVLDTAQELQSLRKTLKEAGRKLLFRAEVATVRNFRFLVCMYVCMCM